MRKGVLFFFVTSFDDLCIVELVMPFILNRQQTNDGSPPTAELVRPIAVSVASPERVPSDLSVPSPDASSILSSRCNYYPENC